MPLAVTIISDGLEDFVISPDTGYRILENGLGIGVRQWKRQTVESPFVHGRTLVGRTLDVSTIPLVVDVFADDATILEARVDAIVGVLERFTFELETEVAGVTYRWACECADTVPGDGGVFEDYDGFFQTLTFSIPRHPIPLEGPL